MGTEEDKTIWLFCGGNSAGKTVLGANIIANICWKGLNQYFKYPLFTAWPYIKKIRIASDPTTIAEKIVPELEKWFPVGRYTTAKRGKNYICHIHTDTGFDISLMTYEQGAKEFESVDLAFQWLDEPPPEKIWGGVTSRLRLGGKILVTMTPLAEAAYLWHKYINPLRRKELREKDFHAGFEFIDIEDNCSTHGVRGYLEHDNVEKMIAQWSPEEREARVHGKFAFLTGVIYKEFNDNIHDIPYTDIAGDDGKIPEHWTRIEHIDFHDVTEIAVTFIAIDPAGTHYLYDEVWTHGTYEELSNLILQKRNGIKPRITLIDPNANRESQLDLNMPVRKFIEVSNGLIKPVAGSKERTKGIMLLHEALKINPKTGKAGFYICGSRCPRTLEEFHRYARDDKGNIVKDWDHMLEGIHRTLLAGFKYNNPTEQDKKQNKGKFY